MNDINNQKMSELLCLADSKWVLGHWYIKVMLNCRTLTDATAFAGMAQDELGHTRALFKFLEEDNDLPEHQLEFAREPAQVHSMALLDHPPQNRGDFMLTTYLAESALWHFLLTFKNGSDGDVAGMVKHFGKESRFHRLNLLGWVKSLNEAERQQMQGAAPRRMPLALQWFNSPNADPLVETGTRSTSVAAAKAALISGPVNELVSILDLAPPEDVSVADWDNSRRRTQGTAIPPSLWESMLPSGGEALLARRPLSVSIKDNIDLFDEAS